MSTVEQRLLRLEDEAAIRELVARFADAATRGDHDTMLSVFSSDAVFSVREPYAHTAKGKKEISEFLHRLRDGRDFFVQFVHSGIIQLNGDKASARWVVHEIAMGPGHKSQEKSYYNVIVFAEDELRKIDGKWLIASRTYPYIFIDTDPFNGKAVVLKGEVSFT